MTHTPGPWFSQYDDNGFYEIGSETISIRLAFTYGEGDADEANARLIAAAPELLEALVELSKSFIGTYTNDQRSDDEIDDHRLLWENKASELIARITGGAQ